MAALASSSLSFTAVAGSAVRPSKASIPSALRSAVSAPRSLATATITCQATRPEGTAVATTRRAVLSTAAAAAAAVLAPQNAEAAAKYTGPPVGTAAPSFSLPSTKGGEIALSDLAAKGLVVLYFYNQDGSPGCSIEAQRFQQSLGEFEKRGAAVVGISMDSLEKHDEFCTSKGLTFPLLSDNTSAVSAAYGADLTIPLLGKFSDRQTFLIGKDGAIKDHWMERDSTMASVKTTAHVDQILASIDSL